MRYTKDGCFFLLWMKSWIYFAQFGFETQIQRWCFLFLWKYFYWVFWMKCWKCVKLYLMDEMMCWKTMNDRKFVLYFGEMLRAKSMTNSRKLNTGHDRRTNYMPYYTPYYRHHHNMVRHMHKEPLLDLHNKLELLPTMNKPKDIRCPKSRMCQAMVMELERPRRKQSCKQAKSIQHKIKRKKQQKTH